MAACDTVEAFVVVQNKNIGHSLIPESLIPEVRDLNEAWVEFTVKDGNGKELYHSGFLKPDGMLDPRAHNFTNRPVTDEGKLVDNHKVWTIHSVAYDNTVLAGRSVLVRYMFRLPRESLLTPRSWRWSRTQSARSDALRWRLARPPGNYCFFTSTKKVVIWRKR